MRQAGYRAIEARTKGARSRSHQPDTTGNSVLRIARHYAGRIQEHREMAAELHCSVDVVFRAMISSRAPACWTFSLRGSAATTRTASRACSEARMSTRSGCRNRTTAGDGRGRPACPIPRQGAPRGEWFGVDLRETGFFNTTLIGPRPPPAPA